jgi:Acetyltransferase (GNAT) domain
MTYSIITNRAAIEELIPRITGFLNQTGQAADVTLTPEYFLEKNELRSAPIVVLIRQGGQIAALLYGKERRVMGIKTGVVECGDHCGDGAVIAQENFKATAVALGALKLLDVSRIHVVRVSLKIRDQTELETIDSLAGQAGVKSMMLSQAVQNILVLEDTFERFLNRLGSHTRRNLRVYRRRVEQEGWRFIARLAPEEAAAACRALQRQQGRHECSAHYIQSCQAALKKVPGSFYAGVCTATGEWVSLAGGWLRKDRYCMLLQLNHARYLRDSVSTVMRSFLIEDLIGSGLKTINCGFCAGI